MGTQIERAKNGRVLNLGQTRDLGHLNDFQHLGHIDAVIAPVGLAVVSRLVKEKFDDFQLVGAGLQQNIRLRHVASARYSLRTRTTVFQRH